LFSLIYCAVSMEYLEWLSNPMAMLGAWLASFQKVLEMGVSVLSCAEKRAVGCFFVFVFVERLGQFWGFSTKHNWAAVSFSFLSHG
jgi:hypothetical protein